MTLKNCMFTENPCYQKGQKITGGPVGILVHSTGANNKTLRRYVQPSDGDANRADILADLGTNAYGNHWNQSSAAVCVHAFIGTNAAGAVETYQVLPFDICCWGCGSGKKGSYNYDPTAHIQFEICEDGLTDEGYFSAAFKEAAEFCAHLCKTYGLTTDKIVSHAEAAKVGYASSHGDPDHWLTKFGKDMDWFRSEVEKLLAAQVSAPSTSTGTVIAPLYRVGTDWQNGKCVGQIGAYRVLDNAIATADAQTGYQVYDESGTVVYPDTAFQPYLVRITASSLYYRAGAGVSFKANGTVYKDEVYTIVEEALNGTTLWGKLKSGAGWISLKYTEKI